jgi:MSHA biogenesis protein MshQ
VACQPNNNNGLLAQTTSSIAAGVQILKATWSETGRIDLLASLANGSGYLGTGLQPATGTTNLATSGCTGAAGPFSPAYFTFDTDTGWKRTSGFYGGTLLQYYSGEPAIRLTVTARNLQNGVTQNYDNTYARDVLFSGLNPDGSALANGGAFSRSTGYPATDLVGKAQLRAADFKAGVATWTGSYTFLKSPTAQTRLRVRATEDLPAAQYPASSSAIPVAVTAGAEPTLLVRSGRIRLPSRFGPAGTVLKIPVSLEYYTGQTWVVNAEDSTTLLPGGIASTGIVPGLTVASTLSPGFASGKAELALTPSVAAHVSVPFALNLGTTNANTSCYASRGTAMTSSTGASLAFLRSGDASCAAAGIVDPSALATFGVYAPETKRIIHTREVYR